MPHVDSSKARAGKLAAGFSRSGGNFASQIASSPAVKRQLCAQSEFVAGFRPKPIGRHARLYHHMCRVSDARSIANNPYN